MKLLTQIFCVIIIGAFLGCSKDIEPSEEAHYFVLAGNVETNFEKIELGVPKRYDEGPNASAGWDSTRQPKGKIEFSIDGQEPSIFENAGGQVPIVSSEAKEIDIKSNSETLYIYVTKHYGFESREDYRIECVYKKKIESEDSKASVTINLEELKNKS